METEPGRSLASGVLWLGSNRAFYAGTLGQPGFRTVGAWIVYASLNQAFHACVQGHAERRTRLAVVPAYLPHRIDLQAPDKQVAAYMVEPDSISPQQLQALNALAEPAQPPPGVLEALQNLAQRLRHHAQAEQCSEARLDRLVLGRPLTPRQLDPRIEQVIQHMLADPTHKLSGEECAGMAHLSFSRFLHLFKQETGVSFRQFRAWRRARHFMGQVDTSNTLTHTAMELGYPDATHFSHSIRQVYGLKPKDVCAAMRGSDIVVHGPHSAVIRSEGPG